MSRPERATERRESGGRAWLAGATVFVLGLALYLRTLHTGLPGPDSGELISVARVLGIAHPPGYPLYTLLAHGFGLVVPWGSYAARIDLFSALLHAAAAAILCTAVARLTGRDVAGLAAGLALIVSRQFWRSALVAEAFPLNSLMAACLWLGLVALLDHAALSRSRAQEARPRGPWPWPAAMLLLITAAIPAQHHTLLLLALPLDLVACGLLFLPVTWLARQLPGYTRPYALGRSHVAPALALALLGLLPLAQLPLAMARHAPLIWGRPDTPAGFVALLTRAEYGSLDVAALPGSRRSAVDHGLVYLQSLPHAFGPLALTLAAAGLLVLAFGASRGRGPLGAAARPLAGAVAGFVLLEALFLSRIPLSADVPYLRGVVERFYPLPHIAVALLVGLGTAALLARVPRVLGGAAFAPIAILLVAGIVVPPLMTHFRTLDQRGNTAIEDLGRNVLASLPRDAVLFSTGDILYNSLTYLTVVRGLRPDVVIADEYLMTRGWYVQGLRRRHPGLLPAFTPIADPDSDYYRGDSLSGNLRWIDHLRDVRPVAFAGFIDRSYGARYEMVRNGYTMVPYLRGQVPPAGERARTAARLLESLTLGSFFRPQDPRGPEAESRWRTTELLASTCFLLCDAEGQALRRAEYPGLTGLGEFLERYARMEPIPDPELLRAAGFLYVYHPEFRDRGRAEQVLGRYLALVPPGPEADGAARLLEAIRSGP